MFMLKLIFIFIPLLVGVRGECIRDPIGTNNPNPTPGSNGFNIKVYSSGFDERNANTYKTPSGYIPGELYTIVISGFREQYTQQVFRGFSIIPIREGSTNYNPVGEFQMSSNATETERAGDRCPGGVIKSGGNPISIARAYWRAPLENIGCIEFLAMVQEYPDIWYKDEPALKSILCEQVGYEHHISPPEDMECCACSEAQYEMSFDGQWSKRTHPTDYPELETLTHFSDIIGASHSGNYSMYKLGGLATDGMKELAEWGNTLTMEEEMRDNHAEELRTIIKAAGLWYPDVLGTTNALFDTDRYHHYISLAAMFGPSPDWLVGISKFDLCTVDCSWKEQHTFQLEPWDAGTDNGTSYMSPNNPEVPRKRISAITTKHPESSPFYKANSDFITPLAKLTLKRINMKQQECKDTYSSIATADDLSTSEDIRFQNMPECDVLPWSPWSLCTATCGKGIRMRSRNYVQPAKANIAACRRQTVEKQFCNAPIAECQGSAFFNSKCNTDPWSAWTECSVTCGTGVKTRTREYDNGMAIKICSVSLEDRSSCVGLNGNDCSIPPDPSCATTNWSDWSPCSHTCGSGLRVRTRLFLEDTDENQHCKNIVKLRQQEHCTGGFSSCARVIYLNRASICNMTKEVGLCQGVFPRYYYNKRRGQCSRFIYSGCRGNSNNFETEAECVHACINQTPPDQIDETEITDTSNQRRETLVPVDCQFSDWGPWSACSKTCGTDSLKHRIRTVARQAQNGGETCNMGKVKHFLRCRKRPCRIMCQPSQIMWSSWSQCTTTCGQGHQIRRPQPDCRHNRSQRRRCNINNPCN